VYLICRISTFVLAGLDLTHHSPFAVDLLSLTGELLKQQLSLFGAGTKQRASTNAHRGRQSAGARQARTAPKSQPAIVWLCYTLEDPLTKLCGEAAGYPEEVGMTITEMGIQIVIPQTLSVVDQWLWSKIQSFQHQRVSPDPTDMELFIIAVAGVGRFVFQCDNATALYDAWCSQLDRLARRADASPSPSYAQAVEVRAALVHAAGVPPAAYDGRAGPLDPLDIERVKMEMKAAEAAAARAEAAAGLDGQKNGQMKHSQVGECIECGHGLSVGMH
jgi:hypothetical protein